MDDLRGEVYRGRGRALERMTRWTIVACAERGAWISKTAHLKETCGLVQGRAEFVSWDNLDTHFSRETKSLGGSSNAHFRR